MHGLKLIAIELADLRSFYLYCPRGVTLALVARKDFLVHLRKAKFVKTTEQSYFFTGWDKLFAERGTLLSFSEYFGYGEAM